MLEGGSQDPLSIGRVPPFSGAHGDGRGHLPDVQYLRWPSESKKRERCQALGVPRLLLLEHQTPAPLCVDALEDWVRPPVTKEDMRTRARALKERAMSCITPAVDHNDMLRYGDRWLALSPVEARLMCGLTESYRTVVSREVLVECGWPSQQRPGRNALDLHILRLRRRIAPLGLALRTVWSRGYLLEPAEARHGEQPA